MRTDKITHAISNYGRLKLYYDTTFEELDEALQFTVEHDGSMRTKPPIIIGGKETYVVSWSKVKSEVAA